MLTARAVAARVAGLVAAQIKAQSVKSIAALVTGYVDDITRDFMDVLEGSLLSSEGRRRHKVYIKDNAEPAYLEGLAEGGIKDAELEDEDLETIAAWIETQLGFVGGLWDAADKLSKDFDNAMITQAQYVDGRRALYERIGTWGDALRDLANQGKASALKNKMVTWIYGDTVHCNTCTKLNGKRHRLSWFTNRGYIPQEIASETLECGGWKCQCRLVDDEGNQVLP